jgi:membrane dipeptidase
MPTPFVDGHIDTLLRLESRDEFVDGRPFGHVDLPRARVGGLAAAFFAVFVEAEGRQDYDAVLAGREPPYADPVAEPVVPAYARRRADELTARLFALEVAGAVRVVRSPAELEDSLRGGPLGAILHFEGAEPIDAELETLDEWYERGLRSVGIVWSRPNVFAEGVPFQFPASPDTGPGLTEPGRRLVRECNRLGILLDLSHVNERGFRDVANLSEAPLAATHSNAHALCASTRNLTDAQLDQIGRSGGVVGLTIHAGMLRADGRVDSETPLERFLEHVDYVVGRIGIDHVAFGSDFDGALVLDQVGDVSKLQQLAEALRARGYGELEIEKFAYRNWLRVLRASWR